MSNTLTMNHLSVTKGHIVTSFSTESGDDRAELATLIDDWLVKKYAIFIRVGEDDRIVKGYDFQNNEWELQGVASGRGRKKTEKVSAERTGEITVVPPVSGG